MIDTLVTPFHQLSSPHLGDPEVTQRMPSFQKVRTHLPFHWMFCPLVFPRVSNFVMLKKKKKASELLAELWSNSKSQSFCRQTKSNASPPELQIPNVTLSKGCVCRSRHPECCFFLKWPFSAILQEDIWGGTLKEQGRCFSHEYPRTLMPK